jgi:hypothetical protein
MENNTDKIRVVVEVKGGLVRVVYADDPDVVVVVRDMDVQEETSYRTEDGEFFAFDVYSAENEQLLPLDGSPLPEEQCPCDERIGSACVLCRGTGWKPFVEFSE